MSKIKRKGNLHYEKMYIIIGDMMTYLPEAERSMYAIVKQWFQGQYGIYTSAII